MDRASLRFCSFKEARLDRVEFGETEFIDTSFDGAKGLSTAKHRGPSYVDLATLNQKLPLTFLRGLGLSDKAIEVRRYLGDEGVEYASCFLSYSNRDRSFAEKLHRDLQDQGVRCWFAPHDLPYGAKTFDEIDVQIERLDRLVIMLSAYSLASEWVEDEVSKAYAEERRRNTIVLMPIRIDDKVMTTKEAWATKLRDQRNIGDFSGWQNQRRYRTSLSRLLSALENDSSSTPPAQKRKNR